ncbi:MAG: TlpA disulfide reductase family protein [Planctomycetota bacterium]
MIRTCTMFLAAVATLGATAQTVVNEGTGDRRASLDKMIYSPAPTGKILQSDEWIGDAPTLGDISGRPMLVFTWAEWYRPSHAVAMLANRLVGEFEDLVVIGVHDDEGWDEAQTFAERRRLSFPIVRDSDGSIRKELKVDQDPDVYVFDRAGQVRYADITTESVRAAIEEVAGEDTDAAANIEMSRAESRADAERMRRLSQGINEGVALDTVLNVPFVKPTAEEYAAVKWPVRELSAEERRRNRRRDDGGTASWSAPGEGWFRDRKPNTEGRVSIVYNWHPSDQFSMDGVMLELDRVQQRLRRDVVVIGVLTPLAEDRRRRNEEPDPVRSLPITTDTIETYVGSRTLDHYLVAMPSGVSIPIAENRGRRDVTPLGSVMIVSTDGVVRRAEFATNWDELTRALDTTLRVDPGVKARRAAEDAFIRAGG